LTNEEFKRYTEECGYTYIDSCEVVYAVNDKRDGVWLAEFVNEKQKLRCCTDWSYPIGLKEFSIRDMYPFEPVELADISENNYKKYLNNMTKLKKEIIQAERERNLKEDFR
jgi:hypothetical protein